MGHLAGGCTARSGGHDLECVVGVCITGRDVDRVGTSSTMPQSSCGLLATLETTRQSASDGLATLGSGVSTLGKWVVWRAVSVARTLLCCAFAFAALLFAAAILVKRSLIFFNAFAAFVMYTQKQQ